jgi:hypothetical protein
MQEESLTSLGTAGVFRRQLMENRNDISFLAITNLKETL